LQSASGHAPAWWSTKTKDIEPTSPAYWHERPPDGLKTQHFPGGQCKLDVHGSHRWPSQCGCSLGHCSSHEHSMQLYSIPSQHLPSRHTVKPWGHAVVLPFEHVGTGEQGTPGGVLSSAH
jgi:hypothetical protein